MEHRRPSACDAAILHMRICVSMTASPRHAFTQTRTTWIAPPKLFSFLFLSSFSSFFLFFLIRKSNIQKLAEIDSAPVTTSAFNRSNRVSVSAMFDSIVAHFVDLGKMGSGPEQKLFSFLHLNVDWCSLRLLSGTLQR